jgi:diguanylate cyclase (GGDEF)-like protein
VTPRTVLVSALLVLLASAAVAQEGPSVTISQLPTSLAGEWLFRTGHDPAYASPFREKRNWQRIHVPGAWERQGWPGFNGHAWYRLSLTFSADLERQDFGLDLGVIGDVDEVFLNGRRIGATGNFPPRYERAKLARRFYFVPREAVRFGERNELAVHVYNGGRLGGLVGPSPSVGSYDSIVGRQFLRDLTAYSLATFLIALALLQLPLFLVQRDAFEHLAFALFLAAVALVAVAPTRWGPALVLGYGVAYRLLLAGLLSAEALLPAVLFRLARIHKPHWLAFLQTGLVFFAAFALVGRAENDLPFVLTVTELGAVASLGVSFYLAVVMTVRHRPWARTIMVTMPLLGVLIIADILTELGLLPRVLPTTAELLAPAGLLPFTLAVSFALLHRWVDRRWGEPVDSTTGLMNRDRFLDRLGLEMERSKRSGQPLSVALLRINLSESSPDHERDRDRAVAMMRRSLRQIDLLSRYDQETYAMLLVETDERNAMAIIERLRQTVATGTPSAGQPRIRTSAGVALFRPPRHAFYGDLLQEAEAAIYAAIAEGGNCTATAP